MAEASQNELAGSVDQEIENRVEAEMTRMLYRSAGFGLFSNFALAVILVAGMWTYFPSAVTLGWLAVVVAISMVRYGINLAYARRALSDESLERWRALFLAGVAAAGFAWGLAGFIFLETDALLPRVLVVLIIAGLNAGAARSLASVRRCYLIYTVTTLSPGLWHFFQFAGDRQLDARPVLCDLCAVPAQHGEAAPRRPAQALPADFRKRAIGEHAE